MTDKELEQAEKDAQRTAEELALLLLLLNSRGTRRVEWRADVGRFYVDGKSVSVKTIRNYITRIERRLGRELSTLTDELERGDITVAEWGRNFEREITAAHVLAGALAVGGIAAAVRNAAVIERLTQERQFADGFRKDVRRGKAGTWARVKARLRSYGIAVNITHGIVTQAARAAVGIQTEARRIRRASESCAGCIEYARRGWIPIEEMPPLGSLDCRWRCRCYLEFR